MTLWEEYLKSEQPTSVVWKIYGKRSRKLICADYGSLTAEDNTIDNMEVCEIRIVYSALGVKYVRVSVKE